MRIGIVGTESDHAEDLLRLMNRARRWSGCEVVAMWGADADRARTRTLAASHGVARIVDAPAELVGAVDAVAVLGRQASEHAGQALPFLEAGLPVFVDKPLAARVADAERMVRAAAVSGAPVLSASALRWQPDTQRLRREANEAGGIEAVVATGTFDPRGPYGGSIFYGVHVVELALELAGAVTGVRVAEAGETALTLVGFAGAARVEMRMMRPREGEGSAFRALVRTPSGEVERPITMGPDYMAPVFDRFVAMAEGGAPALAAEEMLATVQVLELGEEASRRNHIANGGFPLSPE
jgi:predicted dehydrogenase